MCGIVGYFGIKKASNVLLDGLRRLEYRGYDSSGIALYLDGELKLIKKEGKLEALRKTIYNHKDRIIEDSIQGIGHTRWATHGIPNDINAHPHIDSDKKIVMAHNGIIENYREIRKGLENKGVKLSSETDSEVLVQLISYCFDGNLENAVSEALSKVKGTYGILVMSSSDPDKIIAARCGSPLVLGLGDDETIMASDASAILPHTRDVIYLEDFDLAVISKRGVNLQDIKSSPVKRKVTKIDWDVDDIEKGNFDTFMLKEIFEQPLALTNAIRGRINADMGTAILSGLDFSKKETAMINRILVVGCGTSMHAGMVGEYAFEDLSVIPAEVEQAAEFRYRNPIISKNDLVIAISQSGETADTLAAVREAKNKGALVVGICNVVGSTIARETGRGVYLHAGPEIGVASTKAFTCQVIILLMMALKIARTRTLPIYDGEELARWIEKIPSLVDQVLLQSKSISEVAKNIYNQEHCFFIGRGYLYPVALEGALKLKEISYIHAEGYHAAELKHGPIALIEEGTPVVALLNDIPGKEKTLANAEECRARGANVIAVVTEGDDSIIDNFDNVIIIPKAIPMISTIPTVVALQLLAYHVACLRGCDVDQPRNLAKSVTVE